jgi:hypothetical protein
MQARSARQIFAPARGDLARTIILGIDLLRLSLITKSPAEGERSAGLLDWPEQAGGLACRGQQMEWGRSIARWMDRTGVGLSAKRLPGASATSSGRLLDGKTDFSQS